MKSIVLLLLSISISLASFAQDARVQKVNSIVNSKVAEDDPGIMVGVVKNGEIIYESYRGLANLQHRVKVDAKTRSNIASTAKQFTALMILQLSEEGKLNLEDDIRKFLPALYPKVKEEIKIRHLLNHTSGIRDYVELMGMQNRIWWRQMGLDNDDIMQLMEKQEELGFAPGSKYVYSNAGYVILAELIAEVSGESFYNYSKKFFEYLGMNNTGFVKRYMGVIPNKAEPYSDWGYGEWFQTPTVTKTSGEGFLFTTLKDQLIYEQALQNALKNNNQLLIKSQGAIPNSKIKTYGFGLELEDRLGRTAVHHAGGTYGYNSQTIRFPEENLTVFIMSNHGNINSGTIADEIAEVYLPKTEKKQTYDPKFNEALSNAENTQIIGQYDYPDQDKIVRIEEQDGKLYWRENNSLSLEMTKEQSAKYAFVYNPKLKVVFYKNEMVEYYASGKTMVYKRNTEPAATIDDLEGFIGKYYSSELDFSFEIHLKEDNTLTSTFSNDEGVYKIKVVNRNHLLLDDYVLKVDRDQFDRVINIFVDYGRAKNMRFRKKTNLKFQPKIKTDDGSIQVTTIGSKSGDTSDILLTANYPNGNEIWNKRLGGNSWDKASSILATDDGYLIIGSTSSYGNGNYDMYVIKTNKDGKKLWQNTYGKFDNEYGYSAEITDSGYLIKGTIQQCSSRDVLDRTCTTSVWMVTVDKNGKEISDEILEEVYSK